MAPHVGILVWPHEVPWLKTVFIYSSIYYWGRTKPGPQSTVPNGTKTTEPEPANARETKV